jgi:hypothetical protein
LYRPRQRGLPHSGRSEPPNRGSLARVGFLLFAACATGAGAWWFLRGPAGPRLSPEPPPVLPDAPLADDQAISVLDVPVYIDLARLTSLVEREIPVQWVAEGVRVEDGPAVSIALTRGPVAGSYDGGIASLSLTVAYALRTSVAIPALPDLRVSCGVGETAAPRMDVRLVSPLSLTPDWSLQARTRVAHVAPSTDTPRDRCEVTPLRLNATPTVAEGMRSYLAEHTPSIDSVIATIDVRSRFEEWWSILSNPVRLAADTWLELRPEAIGAGPVTGSGSSLEVHGRLSARPRLRFGPPPLAQPTPLPRLATVPSEEQSFEAVVDVMAHYSEVSAALSSLLRGTVFTGARRRIAIDGIAISGLGANRVAVEVTITGDIAGKLYFVGTPSYHRDEGVVSLPDLSMTVATSDRLVAGAAWLLDAGLEAILRERARWPVDVGVDWARTRLEDGLNAILEPGVRLSGELGDLEVLEVHARTGGLLVRARLSGRVELLLEAV